MNSTKPGLPLTPQMVEALRLHDEGKPNNVIADRLGVNSQRASELTRVALARSGRPVAARRPARPAGDLLLERVDRLEARIESMRQRIVALEREVAALKRRPVVTHRRVADGGVGGRAEMRALREAA